MGEHLTRRWLPRARSRKKRRLVEDRQLKLPFESLSDDEPIIGRSAFLKILTERTFEDAEVVARRLDCGSLSESHKALRRSLVDATSARSHRNVAWGEQTCVDALRLRFVGHLDWKVHEHRPPLDEVVWIGALEWLGQRLVERGDAHRIPQRARRALAAAVASTSGYRRAFELVRACRGRKTFPDRRTFGWTSLVALRCVFDGWILPDVVSFLIPPAATKKLRKRSPWLPLCLALRWAVEHRHQAGVVFLLSALMTTAFRRSLENAAVSKDLEIELAPWGCGSLPRAESVQLVRDLTARGWRPWREAEAETGLELSKLAALLQGVLGVESFEGALVFLDEHLLHAALFTLMGNTLSARVHLASSMRSPLTRPASDSIAANDDSSALWDFLERASLGSEGDRIYTALEHTPDPNVALGTPVWAVANHLSEAAQASMRGGKSKAFRSVRSLLQRKDLLKTVEPYWLLGRRDKERLLTAMKWIGRHEPYPNEEAWWAFLESHAEQVLSDRTA